MRVRIFNPFMKVWTPRTPDSNYDSLGPAPAPAMVNVLVTEMIGKQHSAIGTGVTSDAAYAARFSDAMSNESFGSSVILLSATYTPAAVLTTGKK